MNKRKICVITGTRAEYGLLYWVIKKLEQTQSVELQLIVTGMHLSSEFGLTYKQIEEDGLKIDRKIETLLSSDTSVSISKSMGLGMISFAEAFNELKPDIVLVLGDRFEIFSAVSAAMVARIPVAHCHGGEATEGLIDESIRHSITKMSHIHFTSTEEYKNRVIQMGEQPTTVFNTGALGIESINKLPLLDLKSFQESINFELKAKLKLLVTFHPVTLEFNSAEHQMNQLIGAIDMLEDVQIIFTKANADTDGRIINSLIDTYVNNNKQKAIAFASLGQLRYLSALNHIDIVLGNSSSGLLEVPSFKKATINIGDRQKGRIQAQSVIDCEPDRYSIIRAIKRAESIEFRQMLRGVSNPYGSGNPSDVIVDILNKVDLGALLKKKFYNF